MWKDCETNEGESPSPIKNLLMKVYLMQFIASKTQAALDGGLSVILCVGETLEVNEFPFGGDGGYRLRKCSNEKATRLSMSSQLN